MLLILRFVEVCVGGWNGEILRKNMIIRGWLQVWNKAVKYEWFWPETLGICVV